MKACVKDIFHRTQPSLTRNFFDVLLSYGGQADPVKAGLFSVALAKEGNLLCNVLLIRDVLGRELYVLLRRPFIG